MFSYCHVKIQIRPVAMYVAELASAACFTSHWQVMAAWIGGQRQNPNQCESPFVWKYNLGSDIPFNFTKWADKIPNCNSNHRNCVHQQPDCSGNVEHCAHIMNAFDFSWNDGPCAAPICSVCEF